MKGIKILEKGNVEKLGLNDLKQIKGALCGVYSRSCSESGKTTSCKPRIGGTNACIVREQIESKKSK